jgi:uncharacterized protein DUF397
MANTNQAASVWKKSSFSATGNCVQVQRDSTFIYLRDSKDPHGPVLNFTEKEWAAFIAGVQHNEFHWQLVPLNTPLERVT